MMKTDYLKTIENRAKACRFDCFPEYEIMRQNILELVAECRGLQAIVADQEKQLDVWDQKLRNAIDRRMNLREAVIGFLESLIGHRGAILGGRSIERIKAMRKSL